MSAKAKVDQLSARELHQLQNQKIHQNHAAMEALMYQDSKVGTIQCIQFLVHLDKAHLATTRLLDADCQKAMEQFELEIQQGTLV